MSFVAKSLVAQWKLKQNKLNYTVMKTSIFSAIVFASVMMISSCGNTDSINENSIPAKSYNICILLDGTDRISNQAGVPVVSPDEIVEFAKMFANNGGGSLYLGYIDDNCDNNKVAVFEWNEKKPVEIGKKPGYMKVAEYNKLKASNDSTIIAYRTALDSAITEFSHNCETICESAYSETVAKHKKGSDVTGAINQAIRLLRANQDKYDFSYIILVSDGLDNVGKQLDDLQSSKLFIVNSNVSMHQYADIISKEFVTLKQSFNYIFSMK